MDASTIRSVHTSCTEEVAAGITHYLGLDSSAYRFSFCSARCESAPPRHIGLSNEFDHVLDSRLGFLATQRYKNSVNYGLGTDSGLLLSVCRHSSHLRADSLDQRSHEGQRLQWKPKHGRLYPIGPRWSSVPSFSAFSLQRPPFLITWSLECWPTGSMCCT